LRQLHQLGSSICAGFISLAAALAPASPAWQQHLRRLHQPGSSISASFTSLAAAFAPALSAWLIPPLFQVSREGGRRKIIPTTTSAGENTPTSRAVG